MYIYNIWTYLHTANFRYLAQKCFAGGCIYIYICPFLATDWGTIRNFPKIHECSSSLSAKLWPGGTAHLCMFWYIFARVMQMQQYMHTGKDKRMFGRIWMWMDPFKCIDGKLRCVYRIRVCLSSLRILKCMYKWTHALQHTSRWHSPILVHIGGWSNTDPRAHTHKLTHELRKLQTQKMITKVTYNGIWIPI